METQGTGNCAVRDNERLLLRNSVRLRQHSDHSRLSPGELMAAMIVEHGGGFFQGLQHAPRWQETLVIFTTSFGASLAIPLDELCTQAIRQRLELAPAEFG